MSSLPEKIKAKKTIIIAFTVGLFLGPLISGIMGWQVRSKTVDEMVRNATTFEQVKVCEMRARAVVTDPSKLGYSERFKLAEASAKMPWLSQADSEVISQCTNNLAESI